MIEVILDQADWYEVEGLLQVADDVIKEKGKPFKHEDIPPRQAWNCLNIGQYLVVKKNETD